MRQLQTDHTQSQLAQLLRDVFHKRMPSHMPAFTKTGTAFGGTIHRELDSATRRYVFIFLYPDSKYDRFTVEFAASVTADFPFEILPGDSSLGGSRRNRIRSFLGKESDGWWRANESDNLLSPDSLMKLRSIEGVKEGAGRIPLLVDDLFPQLQPALSRFLTQLEATARN